MAEPLIRLVDVTKTYAGAGAPAVDRLNLEVQQGETVVLVGPSGCGKTTTLRMINRLIEPTEGTIFCEGVDIATIEPVQLRRRTGYVIQQIGLFPHRTVSENIATVPALLGWSRAETEARVAELLGLVGLEADVASRYPGELSGGQQQRVGVARALAADPPVLLMDEPFGAVDPIVRARLQDELLKIQQAVSKTIVFVTHDVDEALKLGDRVAVLNTGGVLEQFGDPEQVLREPASQFVEDFLGGERGLKRLALLRVSDIKLEPGPVVEPSASVAEAEAIMMAHDLDWVTVVDGGRLLGWVDEHDLVGRRTVGEASPRPFLVRVRPQSTLRAALDAIVSHKTQVAVVTEGSSYLGMLSLTHLHDELA